MIKIIFTILLPAFLSKTSSLKSGKVFSGGNAQFIWNYACMMNCRFRIEGEQQIYYLNIISIA